MRNKQFERTNGNKRERELMNSYQSVQNQLSTGVTHLFQGRVLPLRGQGHALQWENLKLLGCRYLYRNQQNIRDIRGEHSQRYPRMRTIGVRLGKGQPQGRLQRQHYPLWAGGPNSDQPLAAEQGCLPVLIAREPDEVFAGVPLPRGNFRSEAKL